MNMNSPSPFVSSESIIRDTGQRRRILIGVCLSLMAVIGSVSGLNVAQPQLALAFQVSQQGVLWMINLYTITMAALLLPLGAAGDRWGRKAMLVAGLIVFGLASLMGGLAPCAEVMLAARWLCGVGAAMIMPVTLAIVTSTFPEGERAKAIGVWTAVAGAGGVLGMFISAVLVDMASWRWLFALPIVLVLSAMPLVLRAIPSSRKTSQHGFDFGGALTSLIAVLGFIFVLNVGPERGWTSHGALLSLLIGAGGALGFVMCERRQKAPLLDVDLFRNPGLASGTLTLLAVFGVPTGILVLLYPFLQVVIGWSGFVSTVALMPMPILMIACSALAPRVEARIGTGRTMAVGVFLCGVGLALMAFLVSVDGGYVSVLPGYLVMGIGMGLSMTPSTEAITSSLPSQQQGVASAINDVAREFGSALGLALLGAVSTAGYRHAIEARLEGVPTVAADTARKGLAGVLVLADEAHPRSQTLFRSAQEAFVRGWQQALWVGALVMMIVLAYLLLRGIRSGSTSAKAAYPPGYGSECCSDVQM